MNEFLNKIRDRFSEDVFNRIVLYIDENENGCWLWSNSLDNDGYGRITIDKKTYRAHRLIWELENGIIPKGLVIDHLCRIRNCVNPKHLRLVTLRQNALENSDSITAQNLRKKFCKKGHWYDKIYTSPKGETERYCSICHRERSRNFIKRKNKNA